MKKIRQIKPKEKCEWKDIKVGEVFAVDGCWEIWCKTSRDEAMLLTLDHDVYTRWKQGGIYLVSSCSGLYKLSREDQALWLE